MPSLTVVAQDRLGYTEKKNNLSIRIEANVKYSDVKLEDWIVQNMPIKKNQSLLDIGCGGGNFFPVFTKKIGPKGIIVGMDKSMELLQEASKVEVTTQRFLLQWNMNEPIPLVGNSFDCIVSTFAIYYVDHVKVVVTDIWRVLKSDGHVMLIGPGDHNAKELYELNSKIFGIGKDDVATERSSRLEKEFYPAIKKLFKKVTLTTIPINLVFPNKKTFLRYYLATLLYEESVRKTGINPRLEDLLAIDMPSLKISKEVIVVMGQK